VTSPRGTSRSKTPWIVGAVVAAVVALGVIVAFATGNGDDDVADDVSTTIGPPVDGVDDRLPRAMIGEVRPVEIEGDALPLFVPGGADPALGLVPPTIIGEDYTGFTHQISPDTADPTLVVFLAHWCPACNEEVPVLIELQEQGRLPENLQVYGVMTGVAVDRPNFPPSRWIADKGWPWAVVADNIDFDRQVFMAADAYGLSGYPFSVVINDGVVTSRWSGPLPIDELDARINVAATTVG
jgi:cytochrome c biogenesis protein CcmG, thiol:disulfide interchange protein DsbE